MGLFSEFFSFAAHAEDVDCRFARDNGHITSNSPTLVIFLVLSTSWSFINILYWKKKLSRAISSLTPGVFFTPLESISQALYTKLQADIGLLTPHSIAWGRHELIGGTSWSIQIFKHTCLSHFFSFSRSHQKWLNALAHKFDPTSNKLRLHVDI